LAFYAVIHKPFNVLCQFTSQDGKQTLNNFFDVPVDVYPVGRLDYDSEGLLILTNDKKLNQLLLNPKHGHKREYLVQVDGQITNEAIQKIEAGVDISIEGKTHRTKKCNAAILNVQPLVHERNPPIRFRKNIPTSWISLVITEGKNRQVRKMTASVGFPTLRLIRHRIEQCSIEGLAPGEMRLLSEKEIYKLLFSK
jgi:23S rRNA pseudouridine2457 synthase